MRTKGDEIAWTWGELRERVDALAAGLTGLGLERGDTVALLFGNRPEFHLCDLAVVTAGATPFSIYMQYGPEQIRYVVTDAGARMIITEQQFLANVLEARKELPDLEHVIVIDGEAPEGVRHPRGGRRGPGPGLRRRGVGGAARPAGPAHDHLHLRHHRAAQGRAALAPQPAGRRRAGRAAHRLPARRARHLLAAGRPRGRAQRPPLPADRLRAADHVLRQPARDPRLPARGPALVVLRGPAHLGEAQGRPRGDGRRPARGAALQDARPRCATRCEKVRLEQAGKEVPADLAERVDGGRPRDLRRPALDARARPGQGDPRRRGADAGRGARVLPRHRAAAGRAVGDERDVRRRARPTRPRGSRSAPSGRRRPGSRSSWPRTARSSSAATS